MSKTQPARGMRDFLPSDVRKRDYVIGIIKEVYESYGFEPLETPAVENIETLTGKYGEEGSQLIFKILKRGEKLDVNDKELADLALRYDLTVPLARVIAQHKNDLPRFFKRYQIQPVWRADRPARGRFREFYQCDVDAIGSSSMIVEAELCLAVSEILQRLGFDDFSIRINNRKLLTGILEAAGVQKDKQSDALIALDKLDKIGREGVQKEFNEREVFSTKEGTKVFEMLMDLMLKPIMMSLEFPEIQVRGNFNLEEVNKLNTELLESANNFIDGNEIGQQGLTEIRQILAFFRQSQTRGKIEIDASLARGLSYYTGAIFEINVPDLAGSLGGGGRYDGLIGMFGKEQIPACGFSLGLERILVVMEERGMFQKLIDEGKLKLDSADVLVTVWNEELIGESLTLANELRQKGLRVLVYPEAAKIDRQLKYASQLNVRFVCIVGETEITENKVTLKNMLTREQETVSREDVFGKIKR